MKTNELQNGVNKNLLAQFFTHLQTLNYAKGTIKSSVDNTKYFMEYLEEKEQELQTIQTKEIKQYFDYLQTRSNKKTGLGLSISYIQKIRSSLIQFYSFLELTQTCIEQGRNESYRKPAFPVLKKGNYIPKVLSKEEIQKLFNCCDETLLGKRNKAMLAVYYGLGLRRQEGTNLNIEDVDLNKGLAFISKSKTRKQRNVPLNSEMQAIVEDYLFNVREKLIDKEQRENALLVTERGNRLAKESVVYILKKLLKEAKIKTDASPHTLRHSIATHLLQSGMKLESIALFLGHQSLDSTQIYTHLSNHKSD